MPIVPSVVFNTPIPQSRRGGGGRPSRGGREVSAGRGGSTLQTGNGAEKPTSGAQGSLTGQASTASNERSRAEPNVARNPASGPKPKRSASAGPPTVREQRKGGDVTSTEKRKEADFKGPGANHTTISAGDERKGISASTQTENLAKADSGVPFMEGDALPWNGRNPREDSERRERRPSGPHDSHAHPRSSGGAEKRNDVPGRSFDLPRDLYGVPSARERSEGQRGRGGGYRSRNSGIHSMANSTFGNGQGYIIGQTSHPQSPSIGLSKSHSTHERHPSQSQGLSYMQSQPHARTYRSGSRSQSIPHQGLPYGRYSNGPYTGPPNLPNIQTDMANVYGYQPGHQGIMSAMPFTSFSEQAAMSVFSMVSMQM